MNHLSTGFSSIEQVQNQYFSPDSKKTQTTSTGESFQDILAGKVSGEEKGELKFSKHASMRLDDRNIDLSSEQSQRLEAGVMKANEKGIQDSLVLVDSLAFIVNVPSQTVVTAMDKEESLENVFTNIDGAVIA